ncbi:MAG: sigma-70 family RNA polymerase sigma factor [Akkermansiaceae bacterium]|nr:sigma-70 family RNA polymerase sigma factor [Akkermansiaceae bacterium]
MRFFSSKSDDEVVTQIATHQAEILAYIHSLLPGNASVDDVLQRTNLVLWKKRALFKRNTNFRAWAFSIARWEVRAFLKESKRKSWLVIDEDLARQITETMVDTAEDNPMHDLRPALEYCMEKLKPDERELITHRYYTDAPLKEYAASSGRPLGSIRVSLCRIRATLKRCIEARRPMDQATQTS